MNAARVPRRVLALANRIGCRTGLAPCAVLGLGATLIVAVALLTAFGAVTEDVVTANGVARHDPAALRWFTDHRPTSVIELAKLVTSTGGALVLIPVAVLAGIVLYRRGVPRVLAICPLLALGATGAVVSVTKVLVGRERPAAGLRLVSETNASFPSGHASDSAAMYLALALVIGILVCRSRRSQVAVATIAVGWVALIGASRLVLGVHWATDVVAGWFLGTAVAVTIVAAGLGWTRRTGPPSHRILMNDSRDPHTLADHPASGT